MKVRSDVRAKPARLKPRRLEFFQGLFDVRKAVAAEDVVTNQQIRNCTVLPIDRLPNELLSEIFLLIKHKRESLASVSRHWRAVIINTANIWSDINLDHYRKHPWLLKVHLDRSRQAPLTISIKHDYPDPEVVLPHANRLHTLRIGSYPREFINRISCMSLPSLQYLFLDMSSRYFFVESIRSHTPTLRHLEYSGSLPSLGDLSPIAAVESLEELSLDVTVIGWEFQRDSMYFPSLQRLTVTICCPTSFLEAIVAPKLTYFCFAWMYTGEPRTATYNGSRSKFDNVTHLTLTLSPFHWQVEDKLTSLSKNICQIFRRIRYADIHVDFVSALFAPSKKVGNLNGQRPVDTWTCLESLHIRSFSYKSPQHFKHLKRWFTKRRKLGQRKLHINFTHAYGISASVTLDPSSTFKQTLRKHCASAKLYLTFQFYAIFVKL